MPTRRNHRHRIEQRRHRAAMREDTRSQRSAAEQLARLDAAGHLAVRERMRLGAERDQGV